MNHRRCRALVTGASILALESREAHIMPESIMLSTGMSLTAVLIYDGKEVKDVGESR